MGVAVGGAAVLAVSLAAVWYLRSRKHRRQGLDNQIAEDHYLAKTQGLHGGHHDPRRHGNMQGSGRIWNKTNMIVPDPYALPCAPYPHHPPPEVLEPATPTPSSSGDSNRHQPAFEVRPKARTAWLKGASPQTSQDLSSPSSSLSSPFQPSSTPAAVDRGLSSSFTSEQGSLSQSRPAKPIQVCPPSRRFAYVQWQSVQHATESVETSEHVCDGEKFDQTVFGLNTESKEDFYL